jgi:hypothetical protein
MTSKPADRIRKKSANEGLTRVLGAAINGTASIDNARSARLIQSMAAGATAKYSTPTAVATATAVGSNFQPVISICARK